MSEFEPPSAFVQACQEAMHAYERARAEGIDHEHAILPLKRLLTDGVRNFSARDVRQLQTGESD